MLRSHNHEGHSVYCVTSGCKYLELTVRSVYCKSNLGTRGLSDPILLHQFDLVRPSVQSVELLEKSVCIIRNLKIPLRQVLLSYRRVTTLTAAFDYLLVGKYCPAGRTPVYRILLLVCQPFFLELYEQPLHPAIIVVLACCDLSVPVIAEAQPGQLLVHLSDIAVSPDSRMNAVLNSCVFSRQSE